jgi:hypothetical protein
LFSRNNPGNYPELALGMNPSITALSNAGIDPALVLEHSARVAVGLDWNVSKAVQLYFALDIHAQYWERYYRVFNVDTQTVWEEQVLNQQWQWMPLPRLGVAVAISEKSRLVFDLAAVLGPGNYRSASSTVPKDLELGRNSSNGAIDLVDGGNIRFDLGLYLVFQP